jgi:hypothetical protein
MFQCWPFVDCHMVGRVTLNDVLRFISRRMVHVAFEEHLGDNLFDDDPANPPGFRVPFNVIAALKRFGHLLVSIQNDSRVTPNHRIPTDLATTSARSRVMVGPSEERDLIASSIIVTQNGHETTKRDWHSPEDLPRDLVGHTFAKDTKRCVSVNRRCVGGFEPESIL